MLLRPTKNVREKAAQYWYERRVHIHAHGPFGCYATVESANTPGCVYEVTLTPEGAECTCPLGLVNTQRRRQQPCCHVTAVLLSWRTLYPREGEGETDGCEDATATVRSERSAG